MTEVEWKAPAAKQAAVHLSTASDQERKELLKSISSQLLQHENKILDANEQDLQAAKDAGREDAYLDRLEINKERLAELAEAVASVSKLDDPLGTTIRSWTRPNGLFIREVSVPIGVIAAVFEARPNVTADISALALRTGNAVLLRGSRSAIHTNKAITAALQDGLQAASFPREAVQLIESPDRSATTELMEASDWVDVLIPRGGKELINKVVRESHVPVIETGAGNCHVYIDKDADPELARKIAVDAKVQRPSVCNACETILVEASWAEDHLPALIDSLLNHGVSLRGCEKTAAIDNRVSPAQKEDWEAEYLNLTAAVKIVSDVREACTHINQWGTKHSEAIITESEKAKLTFFQSVDASTLYHNASTRFTDGFEFGFGAEVGISTQKLHARGPMGLQALTTVKYLVEGSGQCKGTLPY
ncbi:glutamate-5-semialdehyde dehydrogenase [Alkalicoccus luteus]|uniref:Gamma-glutamyl phosphate reductase n=1 Tax=Alkalicoccus luteus TaxID=1237094 RepID=A0A969TUS8_9BACI|nr:glutamate-5-semialdehyde dehydrogenase [Alkalicoccus luteus]NJP37281.1 glutamate-5-semialdehyde dehydrogenase [Alkalicoccus luteus]